MKYPTNVARLVGNTPLIEIPYGGAPRLLVKLEYMNPGGSVKDRMAKYIIEKALAAGRLKSGDTIVDNTSGNTGVGTAMIAAAYGLKTIFATPEKTSQEKVDLIKALGGQIIRTPTEASWDDPRSCYQVARRLAAEQGYFHLNQYHSQDNIAAHYGSTGPEIWEQTGGTVTHFIGGIGTGGTVSGVARFLKEKNPAIRIIAVDPLGSMFAEYIRTGRTTPANTYFVEGIGSDMVTQALDRTVIDDVITVTDEDSFATARMITRKYGIMAGGSSGTVAWAALELAREIPSNSVMVCIFADSAIRYLTKCYSDDWMRNHGFKIEEVIKA